MISLTTGWLLASAHAQDPDSPLEPPLALTEPEWREVLDAEEAPADVVAPDPPAPPSPPPRREISAELGGVGFADPGFDRFSSRDRMPIAGLRVGARLHDRVVGQLGWHRGARGARVDTELGASSLATAYFADRFSVGARVDVPLSLGLMPYVAARGELVLQHIRLDDAPNDKTNPNQIGATALAPGGELLGGVEWRLPQLQRSWTLAWTLEIGYAAVARASFRDLGSLASSGVVVHSGLGLRF